MRALDCDGALLINLERSGGLGKWKNINVDYIAIASTLTCTLLRSGAWRTTTICLLALSMSWIWRSSMSVIARWLPETYGEISCRAKFVLPEQTSPVAHLQRNQLCVISSVCFYLPVFRTNPKWYLAEGARADINETQTRCIHKNRL